MRWNSNEPRMMKCPNVTVGFIVGGRGCRARVCLVLRAILCLMSLITTLASSYSSFKHLLYSCAHLCMDLASSAFQQLAAFVFLRLHIDTQQNALAHALRCRLRLSVNNANGQQANEHVTADWKGINERQTHSPNRRTHTSRYSMPRWTTAKDIFPASNSIPGGKHAI